MLQNQLKRFYAGFQLRLTTSIILIAFAIFISHATSLAGDLDSAKRSLEKVKTDVSSSSWDAVDQDIKATEEFLDGLPAADRDPVQKELDGLKAQATAGMKQFKSVDIVKTATRDLDSAADNIAVSPVQASDSIDHVIEKLNGDDAKKYVDADQLNKLRNRATSLKTMAGGKIANQKLEFVAPIVKELDEAMAAQPFKGVSGDDSDKVAQRLAMLISRIRGGLDGVPATDPRVKAINDKITNYGKQINSASGSAMADQAAGQLAKQWKGQQEYFAGWDQEKQGPSWDDYLHHQTENTSNLNMPKTIELLTRMYPWFSEDSVKSTADQYKDNAQVKATLAEAHAAVDAAAVKLNTAFNNLLAEAEKADTPKDESTRDKPQYLGQRADIWFKGTSYRDANVARTTRLSAKWNGAVAGANAAFEDAMKKMTAQATADWPAIAGSIKVEEGFTPDKADQFRGKIVHIKGNNRLGWDFQPGDYRFAREINGLAIAAKFAPAVAAAVEDAKKKTGQDIPDDNWDFYATVEGTGRIQERAQASGDVKVDGQKVGTVTQEYNKPVDCTILQIFALHAGPVAVAGPIPSAGFSFMKFLEHLMELGLCVIAAALVIVKVRPALAAQGGPASFAAPILKPQTLPVLGLALALLGVIWLLATLIIGDLLPAGLLTICGIVIASDFLQARGMLPKKYADMLTPFAMPIAGATVLFGFLHMFLGSWYLF